MHQSITTICIPRTYKTIPKHFINQKMKKCNFGDILSIVEKPLRNNIDYKKVTIRIVLKKSINGNYLLENIKNGTSLKLVYNGMDFWRIFNVGL